MRKPYSANEDKYLMDNFKKMTSEQMSNQLGRNKSSVEHRLKLKRTKCLIGYKGGRHLGDSNEIKLLTQGQRNEMSMGTFKTSIRKGEYINLLVGATKEKYLVEYANENYFSVKRKNYRESFKYAELLQGTVTILV